MTQLIIDVDGEAIQMPESIKTRYQAWEEDESVQLTMIAANMVVELRGTVWRISYQYGYFNDEMKDRVIRACRKGMREPILCSFLPPEGEELLVGEFFVTTFNSPKFYWTYDDETGKEKPIWGDFSMELREVEPHD